MSAVELPPCICGHEWDAHDGHTISAGAWPRTHCSQNHLTVRCEAYYPVRPARRPIAAYWPLRP